MESVSFVELNSQIEEAKKKKRAIIVNAMDGRSQRYVAEKTFIDETKLSRWINSEATLENDELKRLTKYLGVDFK
jgi:hypothetical protein